MLEHTNTESRIPLAERMRPQALAEVVGQSHLTGEGAPFRRAVEAGRLRSAIFWGPPGAGKTSLVRVIAGSGRYRFASLSAVFSGVKELREIIDAPAAFDARPLLVFVDEIHRWNKAQQDALLPHVESGKILLLGATTENPAFHLIPALRSRTELILLHALTAEDIEALLERARVEPERGLGGVEVEAGLLATIARASDGDARRALGMLERLADRGDLTLEGMKRLGVALLHDRSGDSHYDVVSALIKSMRGSDPDAALYWMARMLEGGEDPMFIARRLVIFAAEDVGNADPRGISVAVACLEGVSKIGMPEARILLAQACTFLATSPKSNASYKAMDAAIAEVRRSGALPVPNHLRNAPTALAKELGHGEGYLYPHDAPDRVVKQTYLPAQLQGVRWYHPGDQGYDKTIRERLEWWAKKRSS